MKGELKSLGVEDCTCRGQCSVERWTGLVILAFTLLASVRYKEPTNQWPGWRKVGKILAKAPVHYGKW